MTDLTPEKRAELRRLLDAATERPWVAEYSGEQGNAHTDNTSQQAQTPVLTAMLEYAQAIRGDWSDFDGRSEKMVIDNWVRELRQPDPPRDIEWHRRDLGICMAGGGHWCGFGGHCSDECGCAPCAEDRAAVR